MAVGPKKLGTKALGARMAKNTQKRANTMERIARRQAAGKDTGKAEARLGRLTANNMKQTAVATNRANKQGAQKVTRKIAKGAASTQAPVSRRPKGSRGSTNWDSVGRVGSGILGGMFKKGGKVKAKCGGKVKK